MLMRSVSTSRPTYASTILYLLCIVPIHPTSTVSTIKVIDVTVEGEERGVAWAAKTKEEERERASSSVRPHRLANA